MREMAHPAGEREVGYGYDTDWRLLRVWSQSPHCLGRSSHVNSQVQFKFLTLPLYLILPGLGPVLLSLCSLFVPYSGPVVNEDRTRGQDGAFERHRLTAEWTYTRILVWSGCMMLCFFSLNFLVSTMIYKKPLLQTCGEDLLQSHVSEQYLTPCLPLNWGSLLQAMTDDSGCLHREKGFFSKTLGSSFICGKDGN